MPANPIRRPLPTLVALALAAAPAFAKNPQKEARKERDHEAARAALARGDILPLARVLAMAAQMVPGDVVKIELAGSGDAAIYKLKVLGHDGRLRKAVLDARSGAVRSIEGG